MENIDITIVGAGVIGLAVAANLAQEERAIYVLEKNVSFGQESSSRNSEVLHAGIYYPPGSLKAAACVEGNRLSYEICRQNKIAYKRLGKLIVACAREEISELERLLRNGRENGVLGLKIVGRDEIKQLEPALRAEAALYSPQTGIVDSHSLMRHFFQQARAKGAEFSFQTEVIQISKTDQGYAVTVRDADGTNLAFSTRILINCAGLNSDILARSAGIDIQKQHYQLSYCKGEYFRVNSSKGVLVKHLIYPVPDVLEVSLGIHATPDLGQGLRLGPDACYIDRAAVNYDVDLSKRDIFYREVRKFLPFIEPEDLAADIAGIRAKLQGPGEGFRDFVICDEADQGLPGLVNLIGIDSPGFTSAPFIGRYVLKIVERSL